MKPAGKKHYAQIRVTQGEKDIAAASISQEQWRQMQAQEQYEKQRRQAIRDAEYKRALGLPAAAPLPKKLGTAGGTRAPMASGLRGSRRLA